MSAKFLPFSHPLTQGVILAGGLARRMSGIDKTLLMFAGRTILAHVTERLESQCDGIILNANGDLSRFPFFYTVVPDSLAGHLGPLAGILAALDWTAQTRPDVDWVVSVPGDTPFLPTDLVSRLHSACNENTSVAVAKSGSRIHPTSALWRVDIRHDLRRAILDEGLRRAGAVVDRFLTVEVSWDCGPVDFFLNINAPLDLERAEAQYQHLVQSNGIDQA